MWRVALLAEGVDRNYAAYPKKVDRAVALLAEGVDRNRFIKLSFPSADGRPPRGGRG